MCAFLSVILLAPCPMAYYYPLFSIRLKRQAFRKRTSRS